MAAAVIVLLYHGVIPDEERHPVLALGQTRASAFERQMRWLRDHALVVPLADAASALRERRLLPRRATALTFDDGFRNNAEVAFPILERLGLPATFFVATSHLEPGRLLWFNRLSAQVVAQAAPGEPAASSLARLADLHRRYRDREPASAVASELGVALPRALAPERAAATLAGMTREQLRRLAASDLVEIGSHTVTHPRLTRLAPAEVARELGESRRELEAITGRPVRFLAYPQDDHDDSVVQAARAAGYQAAVAVDHGVPGDPMRIPRVGIYGGSRLRFWAKWLGLTGVARGLRRAPARA